ncbi:Polyketide cyclase / dehydrase and lipid transport [Arthrobacter saudimassiliensis]|uniref:Polyketide cyclase / dehydrase and lipid transport n=1 Tax=Arthrobacter saudimassiliensis TaxID=1461584 RepID=A0A078MLL9_9MICC|nr:Polyketide cyclase / dehydrase and lipid transport [Arthrobacter saudimassiliensis]
MTTVEESIDVAVPVTTAYNQWTQFESFPHFMGGVESVTQTADTMTHWKTKVGGVEREFDAEITEQHPDERVAWKSVDGKSHAGVVTFHRLSDTETRVTVQLDWDPETFAEKIGHLVGADDRQVKSDLARFKEFIESRGSETGAWRGNVDAPGNAATGSGPAPASGAAAAGTGTAAATGSGLHAAPPADPAMDDPESGGPRAGL